MGFKNTSNIRMYLQVFHFSIFTCFPFIFFPSAIQAQLQTAEEIPTGNAQYAIDAFLIDTPITMDGLLSESQT